MNCIYCQQTCIKKGKQHNNLQKYQCKSCLKYQQCEYKYKRHTAEEKNNIQRLNNEGVSISSISRLLLIAKTSVMRFLEEESKKIKKPFIAENKQCYEIDEICTYIKKNEPSNYVYITYAINRKTKQVIDYVVARRTMEVMNNVIEKVISLNPKKVYTDNLNIYKSLIDTNKHSSRRFRTNRIERNHLTVRTNLKRLARKTICYSKSIAMLEACLKIYFWR